MNTLAKRTYRSILGCGLCLLLFASCQKVPVTETEPQIPMKNPSGVLIIDTTGHTEQALQTETAAEESAEAVTEPSEIDWEQAEEWWEQNKYQYEVDIMEHPMKPSEEAFSSQPITEPSASDPGPQPVPDDGSVTAAAWISNINQATRSNPESACNELSGVSTMTREQVQQWICSYSFPQQPLLNGHAISAEEIAVLEANRNLSSIPDVVSVGHGVLTDNADVRTFPTNAMISDSTDERAFDYFQESLFVIGELVLVLHQSADGLYSFVIGGNDKGWVETARIGLTDPDTFEIWKNALVHPIVVTEPYAAMEGLGTFRMGTLLPLLSADGGNLRIAFPRNVNGQLSTAEVVLPARSDISIGFLSYSGYAAARQMEKLFGIPYGWGDMRQNFDCSSAVGAVYRCFGIFLPRNTGNMHATEVKVTPLAGMSYEERRNQILASAPGTLLLMRGHIVMYLGNGEIGHAVTKYSEDGSSFVEAYQCRRTSLDIYTSSLRPYAEAFDYLISFS